MTSVLFLCTGNATRSVLAGAALRTRAPHLAIDTAGTLTVDGCPVSVRTRAAFDAVALTVPKHLSKQAHAHHLEAADLIVCLAPEHVRWVRREHPASASKTATLKRLVRDLDSSSGVAAGTKALDLAALTLEPWEEVIDPGGMETNAYIDCAHEVVALIDELAAHLTSPAVA